jgi:FkbM family methyltransferase
MKLEDFKKIGRRYRRKLLQSLGIELYSLPAVEDIDRKLEAYLPEKGIFVEAGAHDGFTQSNTYYLEWKKKWTGVLVEPIPHLYQECVKERSRSQVFNYALVPFEYQKDFVEMNYAYLMSTVDGALQSSEAQQQHLQKAKGFYNVSPYKLQVPAKNLTAVLQQAGVSKIDFLSLDVEGYELNVLNGLDFTKHAPDYILVECLNAREREKVEQYLLFKHYKSIDKLSRWNFLFQLTI